MNSHPAPAASDQAANESGGLCSAARAAGTAVIATAAAKRTSPEMAIRGHQASTPIATRKIAATAAGRAAREAVTAAGSIRVRSTVGHSVRAVPSTVSMTQPSRLT
jgi:hypothetical protein